MVIDMIQDKLWELKKVGVSFIVVAHVKRTSIDDVMSETQYTILTASTSQKYFDAIKTKLDFLGMAYIDREIVSEKTGKKGFDGKEKMRGRVAKESRIINFRDDSYSLDSKCRFPDIVERIPFDPHEFIKALKDAIAAEAEKSGKSPEELKKLQAEREAAAEKKRREYEEGLRRQKEEAEIKEKYLAILKEKIAAASSEDKAKVKALLKEYGFTKLTDDGIPASVIKEVAELLE